MNLVRWTLRIAANLAMLAAVVVMTEVATAPFVYGGF